MKHFFSYVVEALVFLLVPVFVHAQVGSYPDSGELSRREAIKSCLSYTAKRDDVPVFEEPDLTSKVIASLRSGEHVCYIGEQQGFAILDWSKQDLVNARPSAEPTESSKAPKRAFVRLVELWQPQDGRQANDRRELVEQIRDYFYYLRYGGVPDDVLGPLRSWIGPFINEPQCEAGKICEKLKQAPAEEKDKK